MSVERSQTNNINNTPVGFRIKMERSFSVFFTTIQHCRNIPWGSFGRTNHPTAEAQTYSRVCIHTGPCVSSNPPTKGKWRVGLVPDPPVSPWNFLRSGEDGTGSCDRRVEGLWRREPPPYTAGTRRHVKRENSGTLGDRHPSHLGSSPRVFRVVSTNKGG